MMLCECVCFTYMFIVGSYINRNKVCVGRNRYRCVYKIVGRVRADGCGWDVEMRRGPTFILVVVSSIMNVKQDDEQLERDAAQRITYHEKIACSIMVAEF